MRDTPTDTGAALLAACRAHPEEDTPRLVYADYLEGESVLPNCPACGGTGGGVELGPNTFFQECRACSGTGKAKDDRAERAELIRLQVELAKFEAKPVSQGDFRSVTSQQYGTYYTGDPRVVQPLKDRERELIDKHPHWLPACPTCGGAKFGTLEGPKCPGNPTGVDDEFPCLTCNAAGTIGTLTRGFVEELPVRWEWIAKLLKCAKCHGRGHVSVRERGEYGPNHYQETCDNCGGRGSDWHRTPWACDLVARHPLLVWVPLVGREPYHNGCGWAWFDSSRNNPAHTVSGRANLPTSLFVCVQRVALDSMVSSLVKPRYDGQFSGRYCAFKSRESAEDALALAVAAWVRSK